MNDTCKKCGKTTQGNFYTFHYGTQVGKTDSLIANGVRTTTHYQILGAPALFLCDGCVNHKRLSLFSQRITLGLAGVLVFCMTLYYGDAFQKGNIISLVMLLSVIIIPFFSFWQLFSSLSALNRKITAEDFAIEIWRKNQETQNYICWNTDDFNKLS